METPTPAELHYMEKHIKDDRRLDVIVANAICFAIALVAVILRFISRRLARVQYGWDDWSVLLSLMLYAPYITCAFTLTRLGMGRHIILLTDPRRFAIYTMCAAVLYSSIVVFFKLSILFFYRRIFPQFWFTYLLIAAGLWVIATGIAIIFSSIFQCVPISSQWDPKQAVGAKCIDYASLIFVGGILSSLISIFILLLPLPLIWQLQISYQKKKLLVLIFALGGGECIITIVRTVYARTFKGPDATWGNVPTANLITVEIGIGILCTCLPAYRPLVLYLFPNNRSLNGRISNVDGVSSSGGGSSSAAKKRNISAPQVLMGGKVWRGSVFETGGREEEDDAYGDAVQLANATNRAREEAERF